MEEITSTQNARVKEWVRLLTGKGRRRAGQFLVEGAYEWKEALVHGVEPLAVIVCPSLRKKPWAEEGEEYVRAGLPVFALSPEAFGKLSLRDNPDGIMGVGRKEESGATFPNRDDSFLLVVNRLEKPGNLGALLRTALAVGVSGIVNCDPAVDFEHPQVIRASRGLVFSLPRWAMKAEEALVELVKDGYRIVAAEGRSDCSIWQMNWKGKLALVLGEEHAGLPAAWKNSTELEFVSIPMMPGVDSLNVSVSGSILMYEWLRRRVSTEIED